MYQDAWKKQLNSWTDDVARTETNPKKIYEKVIAKAKAWKKQHVGKWWEILIWLGCGFIVGFAGYFIYQNRFN